MDLCGTRTLRVYGQVTATGVDESVLVPFPNCAFAL